MGFVSAAACGERSDVYQRDGISEPACCQGTAGCVRDDGEGFKNVVLLQCRGAVAICSARPSQA